MSVFSPQWESEIRQKYDGLPPYDQPNLYRLATDPEAQPLRRRIQEWVGELPASPRLPLLVKRLQSSKHFWEAYHELAVGSVLRGMGYKLHYEMPLSDASTEITPDWSAVRPDGAVEFVVEVFTANPSDEAKSGMDKWHWLLSRLREIPRNVTLGIRELSGCDPPDKTAATEIAERIEQWLSNDQLCVGMELRLAKIRFTIERIGCKSNRLQFIGPTTMLHVNLPGLKSKICRKVAKYRSVLDTLHIPLVVAVVPGDVALDREDLYDALLGQQAIHRTLDGASELIRHDNGLFTDKRPLDPLVSAVAWVSYWGDKWRFHSIDNPHACYSLLLRSE
jgi:hypothetical protein